MLTQERQNIIRTRLVRDGKVIAAELASEFDVSDDTVRRDLRDLAGQGVCERVYGGAILRAPDSGSIQRRRSEDNLDKRAVAERAAQVVQAGQVVFIDAGSTNLIVARSLPQDLDLTVVTNAPLVADALGGHARVRVVLLGGIVDHRRGAALGGVTLRAIEEIHADLFFVGTCGLDAEAGLTAFDAAEAEVKRAMAGQSDKLGTRAPFRIAAAIEVNMLVATSTTDPAILDTFAGLGVVITLADLKP
jgi:DeoR/GlpR family transcriptional regulator of sugar metabolism